MARSDAEELEDEEARRKQSAADEEEEKVEEKEDEEEEEEEAGNEKDGEEDDRSKNTSSGDEEDIAIDSLVDSFTGNAQPDASNAWTEIEETFERLRRAVQQERARNISTESQKIRNGTHPDYIAGIREIEERVQQRKRILERWRQYAIDAAIREFNSNKLQAERAFVESRINARLTCIREANRLRHRVEFEKRLLDGEDRCSLPLGEPLVGKDTWNRDSLVHRREYLRLLSEDYNWIQDQIGVPALLVEPLRPEEIQDDLSCIAAQSTTRR